MAIQKVTVNARTKGKSPQMFTYQGIGKVTPRNVKNADGEDILVDGKPVVVDDIDAEGLFKGKSIDEGIADLTALFLDGKEQTPENLDKAYQAILDGAASWFNYVQRKNASPVTPADTSDELTPLVSRLLSAGILADDKAVTAWRRAITMGAQVTGMEKLAFAEMSKEFKALQEKEKESQPVSA